MKRIILFDGVCNLCNSAVLFVIRRDPTSIFTFASLQGDQGAEIARQHQIEITGNSFLLIENNKVYSHSTAALKVARELSGPVKLLYGFIIVPRFIRDWVYNVIARNRYKWFGKRETCMVPTPELEKRFLN